MSSQFQLEQYFQTIQNKSQDILQRPSKQKIPFDILDNEMNRQNLLISLTTKQKQMKYGEIWQMAIGNYNTFQDLRIGHHTGLDILSEKRKIAIELNNRHNTDNTSSRKSKFDKLAKFKNENPHYECIYGIINDKTIEGTIKVINHNNQPIKYYSGDKLFTYIFGNDKIKVIKFIKIICKRV